MSDGFYLYFCFSVLIIDFFFKFRCVVIGQHKRDLALNNDMSQKLKNSYQAKSTVQMWQKYFKNKKSRNLLIFFRKNESIVIEYSLIIFIFRTKSLSLNSQCHLQAEPHLSISDFLSTYLVHLERKVHAPRPDQILWSSLEVGKSRRFSRYLSLP